MSVLASNVLILLLLLALVGAAQVFLSTRPVKGLGLILPAVCLVCSLIVTLGLLAEPGLSREEMRAAMGGVFLLSNLPTAVLLVIYFICRGRSKQKENRLS